MFQKLCSIIATAAIFVMMITPVTAADNTSAFPRYVNTFDDETSLDTLSGGTSYYLYEEETGVDGNSGRLFIPAASVVNTGFVYDDILEAGKKYKLSFWVKKANANASTVYPLLMFLGANVEITAQGSSSYEAGTTHTGKNPWYDGSSYIPQEDWSKAECIIDMSGPIATLGSSSKVKITSYNTFQLRFRGSGAFYIDNVSFEPVYEYTTVETVVTPTGNYVAGDEILPASRTITTRYSTTIGLGQSDATALVTKDADVTLDANGRGTVKYGGQTGDMAFVAVSAGGQRYIRFQGHEGGYTFLEKLDDRKVYQVTVRMKAPAFVTDSTITDSTYHITSDGVVKVKSGTNGADGGMMSMGILRSADEGRIPVHFTTSTVLTSEWVDYVGYIYFHPDAEITWENIPTMQVTVDGSAGIFYIDEFSMKPMEYDDGNLAINGDFSLTNGTKAIFYDGADYTVTADTAYGNCLTVTNEENEKVMPEMVVSATNTQVRNISFYAKGEASGTLTAKAGSEALTPLSTSALTTEWTKYAYTYTSQSAAPENLVIAADVNFSVADVKILAPVAPVVDKFTAFEVAGHTAETHTLDISYTYPTNQTTSYFVRISRGDDTTGYLPVYESETTSPQAASYSITDKDVGKRLLVEALVIQGDAIQAVKHTTDVVQPALTITPEITGWNQTTHKISAKVSVTDNRASGDALNLFAVMVLVGDNEKVLNIVESPVDIEFDMDDMVGVSQGNVNGIAPKYAKLYVWEGSSIFDTTMVAYTDEVVYTFASNNIIQ